MAADNKFKRGDRIYASGWLTGVIITGLVKKNKKGEPMIMVELDTSRTRMWWSIGRITKDYDL